MKLSRLVFVFLMCYIAFLALQTAQAQSLCGAPQVLSAQSDGPILAEITWKQGSGATPKSYRVYVDNVLKSTPMYLPPASFPSQSYSFVAKPSTTYILKVTAVDSNNVESAATSKTVVTPTNVPSGITVNGLTGEAYVEWTHLNGMESYTVYRTINNGTTWVPAMSGIVSFTSGNKAYATVPSPAGRVGFAVTSKNRFTTPNESAKSITVYADIR